MSIHYNFGIRPPQVTKAQLAAWLDQAMRAHREGAIAQANQLYNTILKNDPKNVGALHMQGVLAYQAGHLQMAVDLIGQAIKLAPDDAAPHINRGLALSALKRYDEALAHFERATSLRPDFAEAYVNRGITLKELSRPEDAIASYDQAIALGQRLLPQARTAYREQGAEGELGSLLHNLAQSQHARGRLRQARQFAQEGLDLALAHQRADHAYDAYAQLVVLSRELGRPQDAQTWLQAWDALARERADDAELAQVARLRAQTKHPPARQLAPKNAQNRAHAIRPATPASGT